VLSVGQTLTLHSHGAHAMCKVLLPALLSFLSPEKGNGESISALIGLLLRIVLTWIFRSWQLRESSEVERPWKDPSSL
jgi:hypothetical protein